MSGSITRVGDVRFWFEMWVVSGSIRRVSDVRFWLEMGSE